MKEENDPVADSGLPTPFVAYMPKPDRVGIILVHGIGEQRRFEHLEAHARDLVDAMLTREERTREERPGRKTSVSVEVIEAEGAAYKAEQASWASTGPTLHAVVRDEEGAAVREVHLCFHEVWYADVAETFSLWKQVRFCDWGQSQTKRWSSEMSVSHGQSVIRCLRYEARPNCRSAGIMPQDAGQFADLAPGDLGADVVLRSVGVQRDFRAVEHPEQFGLVGVQPREQPVQDDEAGPTLKEASPPSACMACAG